MFFTTVPWEQYLATSLFLLQLSKDSLKKFQIKQCFLFGDLYSLCIDSKHLTHQIYHLQMNLGAGAQKTGGKKLPFTLCLTIKEGARN